MECDHCGEELERIDYPDMGMLYHKKDVEWGIHPDMEDPGWLVPKSGAIPASYCGEDEES